MKNVTKMSYLRREFIKFENEDGDLRYLIYTRNGSICSASIETITMIIEQILNRSDVRVDRRAKNREKKVA